MAGRIDLNFAPRKSFSLLTARAAPYNSLNMHIPRRLFLSLALVLCSLAALAQQPQHLFFRVTVGSNFTAPVSGRMLVFLTAGTGAKQVDENPFAPTAVYVAAK
ncbi:MAG: hypothetical protein WBQ95_02420, partial [Terracidiphilus sp.]